MTYQQPYYQPPPEKRGSTTWWIVGSCGAILVLVTLCACGLILGGAALLSIERDTSVPAVAEPATPRLLTAPPKLTDTPTPSPPPIDTLTLPPPPTEAPLPTDISQPPPTATFESLQGNLVCEDCASAGILVNLWEHPADATSNRGQVVGELPHKSSITIEDEVFASGEERFYYFVVGQGAQGWVAEPFTQVNAPQRVWLFCQNCNSVTVFTERSENSTIVADLPEGDEVELIETVQDSAMGVTWYKIKHEMATGWVSQGHISLRSR